MKFKGTKFRIRKIPQYSILYYLEYNHWLWGWTKAMAGTETQCREGLARIRKYKDPDVIHEETM